MTTYNVNPDSFSAIQFDGTNGNDVATFIASTVPGLWSGSFAFNSSQMVFDDSTLSIIGTTVVPVDSWLVAPSGGTKFYRSKFDSPIFVVDNTTFTANFTAV